jgi:hypothetical protein
LVVTLRKERGQGKIRPMRQAVWFVRRRATDDGTMGVGDRFGVGIDGVDGPLREGGFPKMRQLGDFAAWLGLILIVLGTVYYTPKLVQYMSEDPPARTAGFRIAARPPGWSPPGNKVAMRHGRFGHRPQEHVTAN